MYGLVSSKLARAGDRELRRLIDNGAGVRTGIGGAVRRVQLDGVAAFVKVIALTQRELDAGSTTANLFELPMAYHYGMGSTGFGAWRELAMLHHTTDLELAADSRHFPLMYHARVLQDPSLAIATEDIEASVAYWNHSEAVRRRLTALAAAPAAIVVFMEFVPQTASRWLTTRAQHGDESFLAALLHIQARASEGLSVMRANGWVHLDAHMENILTDGVHVYLADLGLAISAEFALDAQERAFQQRHRSYDEAYLISTISRHMLIHFCGEDADLQAIISAALHEEVPDTLPPNAAAWLVRHAPVLAVVRSFYQALRQDPTRLTRYPAEAIEQALALTSRRDHPS
jgi:DNA/RNA-binding domain of Phe-tRNA-synthetase-like protein